MNIVDGMFVPTTQSPTQVAVRGRKSCFFAGGCDCWVDMVVHSKQEKWSAVTFRLAVRHQSSSKRGTKYI